jgi:hypothetical protein
VIRAPRPGQGHCLVGTFALLLLTGCAGTGGSDAEPRTAETATAVSEATEPAPGASPRTPDVRILEITVVDNGVTPPPSQVDLAAGETLRLVVTSDRDSQIHAHGFGVEADVPAGQPTSVDVIGTVPGVYEVELHNPDLLLLQVAVR